MTEINPDTSPTLPEAFPALWDLRSDKKPLDDEILLVAVRYLEQNPKESPWSKQCAELLASTNISSLHEAERVFDILLVKYPTLFPCVTVTAGHIARQIPKARLAQLSEKFAAQFSSRFSQVDTLKLDVEEDEASAAAEFLDYLASVTFGISGEPIAFKIKGDTLLGLFTLAHQHGVLSLVKACLKFVEKKVDTDSLPTILLHAAGPQQSNQTVINILYPELFWTALSRLSNVQGIAADVPKDSPEATLLAYVRLFKLSRKISFPIIDDVPIVTIEDPGLLKREVLQALQGLHAATPIRGLDVGHATTLDSLSFIKTPQVVKIGTLADDTPATIPETWLQHARRIDCLRCTSLKTLDAPNAKIVICRENPFLTTLSAVNAEQVWCQASPLLTTIIVPKALYVVCRDCIFLNTLLAPEAGSVRCEGCTFLSTLSTPRADRVVCARCTSLTTLDAPEAIDITCDHCTSLLTLNAPKATMISCQGCTSLVSLSAPYAIDLDCTDCSSLKTLHVPRECKMTGLPTGCEVTYVD